MDVSLVELPGRLTDFSTRVLVDVVRAVRASAMLGIQTRFRGFRVRKILERARAALRGRRLRNVPLSLQ